MSRLRRWHDKIKFMPADRYFGRLGEINAVTTLILSVLYLTTNTDVYMWLGLASATLAVICLEKAAHARRTARNSADESRGT